MAVSEESGGERSLGSWLRRQREDACLTQQELAERSGFSVRAISNLEQGRTRRPYPNSVRLLTDALGLAETVGAQLITQYRAKQRQQTGWALAARPGSGSFSPGVNGRGTGPRGQRWPQMCRGNCPPGHGPLSGDGPSSTG